MSQFVGNEFLAVLGVWSVVTLSKEDILSGGEGFSPQLPGELIGFGISMNSYIAEVVPELRFKRGPY
jgi:hypothetical protein